MKMSLHFDMPDESDLAEKAYKAEIAWSAIRVANEKIRGALKHCDDEQAFRDLMIETREVLSEALGEING